MIPSLPLLRAGLAGLVGALSPSTGGFAQEAVAGYGSAAAPRTLIVRGATDIAAFDPVLQGFAEASPELHIRYEQWGSNGLYENAAAACRGGGDPPDMVVSSAIDLQVKLVNDGCARPYRSAATALLPESAKWRDEIFGVTREPAVMVYNRALIAPEEAPRSRFDLLDLLRAPGNRFVGRVATYDIESSGLGYLFAFADAQQATTFGSLLEAFGRSGTIATCCSAEIIDAVADGRYLVGYNILGSYALARAAHDPRIAVVAPHDYTLILARAALIPKAARQWQAAGALLDFMLSEDGRRALAQSRLVVSFDASDEPDLEMPEGATSLLRPIPLSPALLVGLDQHKRALFIARWRAAFGRE